MPNTESLDVRNVMEIEEIRKLLRGHPDLLSMFEVLCIVCNKRLNEEEAVVGLMEISEQLEVEDSIRLK